MIFDLNEENLNLLAIAGCPVELREHGDCLLLYDDLYGDSPVDTCRACWLNWLSKESEGNHG